jgi:hypothetical protein
LISRGAEIETLDTYGMTPLHRMASNNLAVGAEALLKAGAEPNNAGKVGMTPLQMAKQAQARQVAAVIEKYGGSLKPAPPKPKSTNGSENDPSCPQPPGKTVIVSKSGNAEVNQKYVERDPTVIPNGFDVTCKQMGWNTKKMWLQLSDQRTSWFEAPNGSYIYWNQGDGKWWIDAPDGKGVYVVKSRRDVLPSSGWQPLPGAPRPAPTVEIERKRPAEL